MSEEDNKLQEEEVESAGGEGEAQPQDGAQQPQQELAPEHSLEEYYYAQKISMKDITEHLTGPVISVIVHVIIITLLLVIVIPPPSQKNETKMEVKEVELKEVENLPEPPPPPEDMSSLDESAVQVVDRPSAPATAGANFDATDIKVDAGSSLVINLPDVMAIKPSTSAGALKVSSTYQARATTEGRAKLLKTYHADVRNEDSVEKALTWLKENQNDDGTWGVYPSSKYAFTALATLAMLAHGETPSSQKYGQCMIKSIKRLTAWANETGSTRYIGDGMTYSHAIVAYTLAEIYGVTKIPKVKTAMDNTVGYIVNNINNCGTYSYWYDRVPQIQKRDEVTGRMPKGVKPMPPSDLSFSGWNYQALKSAVSAGCDVPGLEVAVEMAIKGLRLHCNEKTGGFSLGPGGANPDIGMTSVGILCMGLLGDGDSKEARKSLDWLKKNYANGLKSCSWRWDKGVNAEYEKAFSFAVFTWYYQTQMLFQSSRGQGVLWNSWNNAFSKSLIDEQNPDGSWLTPSEKYGEAHLDPKKTNAEWHYVDYFKDPKDLKIYATTMCALSLEVYYRYLPTYKLVKENVKKTSAKEDDLSL